MQVFIEKVFTAVEKLIVSRYGDNLGPNLAFCRGVCTVRNNHHINESILMSVPYDLNKIKEQDYSFLGTK
jgi:hypothetical protein